MHNETANAVLLNCEPPIAVITLNRPNDYNAFNADLRSGLLVALRTLEGRRDIRVVIIAGNGPAFCAGQDLKEAFPPSVYTRVHAEVEPVLMGLRRLDKVVIAAVHGVTAGIGIGLIAAADLALMADNTYVTLAFSKIGLIPDGGVTWELLRGLGYKRAFRLMIESGKLTPLECQECGLVNELVPANEIMERALTWAQQLSETSPIANVLTKRVLHQVADLTLAGAIAYETVLQERAAASADCAEGVRAFLEKRPPCFPGF